MKPVHFLSEAKDELAAAVAFYEERRAGLGMRFQTAIEDAVASISQYPHRFARYRETEYRKCVIQRFPYVIYFWERDDVTWIMAVAHGRRRPGYWMQRQPGTERGSDSA